MQEPHREYSGNHSLSAKDFQWGKVEEGIQIGLWSAHPSVEVGKQIELRAAVRNLSGRQVELENHFGLAIQSGEEVFEYFGGPRPSTPILLEPGEYREIFGWRLGELTSLNTGIYKCWVIYRPKSGKEIRSKVVRIDIQPND